MKNNKYLKYVGWLVIAATIFLFGISIGRGYRVEESNVSLEEQTKNHTASIMIDYGNGTVSTYSNIPVIDQMSAFDLLKSAADKNKVVLDYKDYGGDMGTFIKSIGGIGKDPSQKKYWQYWVNNIYSQVGVSGYKVHSGDVLEFKFVQGQL